MPERFERNREKSRERIADEAQAGYDVEQTEGFIKLLGEQLLETRTEIAKLRTRIESDKKERDAVLGAIDISTPQGILRHQEMDEDFFREAKINEKYLDGLIKHLHALEGMRENTEGAYERLKNSRAKLLEAWAEMDKARET